MDQRGVVVVVGDVDAEEVHIDWVFLPYAVQQHYHPDVTIYDDGHLRVLHDGNPHTTIRNMIA